MTYHKINNQIEELVVEMYQSRHSYADIKLATGGLIRSDGTIARIIKKHGVKREFVTQASNTVLHDYFDVIDHPNKAYWLGMLKQQ